MMHRSFVFNRELGRVVEVEPRPMQRPSCPGCGGELPPGEVPMMFDSLGEAMIAVTAAVGRGHGVTLMVPTRPVPFS